MRVLKLRPVLSRFSGFLVALPCLWEKLKNLSFPKVSKQFLMSFSWHSYVSEKVTTLFGVTSAILLQGFQKMTHIFRGKRSTLGESCCMFLAYRNVRVA